MTKAMCGLKVFIHPFNLILKVSLVTGSPEKERFHSSTQFIKLIISSSFLLSSYFEGGKTLLPSLSWLPLSTLMRLMFRSAGERRGSFHSLRHTDIDTGKEMWLL